MSPPSLSSPLLSRPQSLAGLPSSFSPTAAYNTGLLIVELLVVAGAQWAIRHGLVNDELSAELLVPKAAGGAGPRAVGGDEEAGLLSDGGASTAGAAPPVQTATTVLAAIRNRARASATPPSEGGSGLAAAEAPASGAPRATLPGPTSRAR
mmetsp:Transcript_11322/g.36172  ORF Transcript_11322/g.36172 Transcript_11322/m.36172 type:complete len:151 (+) Transcript_11322:686-1138(+)